MRHEEWENQGKITWTHILMDHFHDDSAALIFTSESPFIQNPAKIKLYHVFQKQSKEFQN